jgi:hypothetical protein
MKSAMELLEYVVEYHEWCDHSKDFEAERCACGRAMPLCEDQGKCDGCQMRNAAVDLLNAREGSSKWKRSE